MTALFCCITCLNCVYVILSMCLTWINYYFTWINCYFHPYGSHWPQSHFSWRDHSGNKFMCIVTYYSYSYCREEVSTKKSGVIPRTKIEISQPNLSSDQTNPTWYIQKWGFAKSTQKPSWTFHEFLDTTLCNDIWFLPRRSRYVVKKDITWAS